MSIVFAANYNNLRHIIVPFCIYRELSVAEKNLRSIHNCRQKYITEPKKGIHTAYARAPAHVFGYAGGAQNKKQPDGG